MDSGNMTTLDPSCKTRSPMMLNGEKELLQQEWNNGDYSLADDRYKTELVPHLPQYPLSFTQGLSNGNVVIEPMAGTKAAVAQFAENNLMPTDMALLHSTIYSLQQQQVLMMHILQQLQQQLVAFLSKGKVTQVPSGPPTLSPPIPVTSGAGAPQPIPAITDSSDRATRVATPANSAVVLSCTALPSTVPSITTSAPSSGILDNNDIHSTSMSSLTAHSLDYSRYRPGFLPRNPLVDLLAFHSPKNHHKPGSLERQPFGHQPFYKQKCKYCHKVFSSDNNFQLHMKSHAAKSPYRCNVCGIKFSSKGSLRLHFARHKPKVSHVKLHPHHPLPLPSHSASTHSTKNNTILPSSFTPVSSVSVSLPSRVITSPHISSTVSHASEQFIPASVPHPLAHVADRTSPAALVKQDNTSKPSSQMEPTSTSPVSAESVTPVASSAGILHLQPIVHLSSPKSSSPGIIQSPPIRNLSTTIATTLNSISLNASASGTFPILSPISVVPPLSSFAAFAPGASPSFTSPPVTSPPGALFPSKSIEPGENIEDYMEMTKSETSKLQQLVENIEQKLNDPNECVICHRVLSCKSALQMHYRIHTGERPFRCKICGRSFTTKGNLKTHMGVHRAKPPLRMMHQCPVCHKQFTNIIVLQQHIRMHTGEPLHSMTSSLYRGTDWHPKPYIPPHMDPHMEPRELDLSKSSGFPLSSASSFASSSPVCSPLETNKQSPLGLDAPPKLSAEKAENKLSDEQMETNDNKDEWDESKVHTDLSPQIENAPEQQERSNSAGSIISQESANSHKMDNIIPLSKYESQITSVITSSFVPPSSTSLAALEERVRAISSHTPLNMASTKYSFHHHSMSQHKPFSPPISHGGFSNGNRSPDDSSPRNLSSLESGSEANGIKEEIGSQTSTQPLSLHPESRGFPIGSVFPLAPALDLRPSSMEERLVTTCNICYKTFACRSALDIHYRSHTKERPYKCEVCDRSFSTRGNMKQHMLTHKIRDLPSKAFDENNDSSCDSDRQEDQRQIDPVSEQQPFKMESTNSIGGSQSPFVRRTSPKHLCSICQKHFSSQSALQIHIRTHTGDKPFKCNVCGKAFTTKGNLKVHMGTHMWNNSPSRRGRRMSIEPPFLVGPKDNPYLPPYSHRSPDVFFQYPHFLNGISPKMNEISVIQSLNGGVNHIPNNHHHHHHHHHHSSMGSTANNSIMDSSTPKEDSRNTTPSDGGRKSAENQPPSPLGSQSSDMNSYELMTTSGTGELDLSMKSTAPVIVSTSPVAVPSPQTDMAPEAHQNLSAWSWRTVCQICNQLFPSPPALEHHIRTQHSNQEETMHQMAIPN